MLELARKNFGMKGRLRASAQRASKMISNLNKSIESIFHTLSELVLKSSLRGHMTEQINFQPLKPYPGFSGTITERVF